MRQWSQHPDPAFWYRLAEPDDSDLDDFNAGDTLEAEEVNQYFRSRQWFDYGKKEPRPPVYQFGTPNAVVGYFAISFGNRPHPNESNSTKARYLILYVLGIHLPFQGLVNPYSSASERYASTTMRMLETHFATQKAGCVGLYLRVRESNTRAIRFYERLGFILDTKVVIDSGPAQSIMRKLFEHS